MSYQEEKEELLKEFENEKLINNEEVVDGIYVGNNTYLILDESQNENFKINVIQNGYEPFDGQYNYLQNKEFSKEELKNFINSFKNDLSNEVFLPIENAQISLSEEDFDSDFNADWKDDSKKFKDLKLLGFEKLPMSYTYEYEPFYQEPKIIKTLEKTDNNVLYAIDEETEKIYKISASTQKEFISNDSDYSRTYGNIKIEEIEKDIIPNIQYSPKEKMNISIYELEEMDTTKTLIEIKDLENEDENFLELKVSSDGDYGNVEGYAEFDFKKESFIENKERTNEINSAKPFVNKEIFEEEKRREQEREEKQREKEEREREEREQKEKEETENKIRKEAEEEIRNSLSPFEKFKEAMFHNVIGDRVDKLVDERMNDLYPEDNNKKDNERTYNLPVFDKNKEKEIATENDNNKELEF